MRRRFGVGIGAQAIRALLIEDGEVCWSLTQARGVDEPLGATLEHVFERLPRRGRRRPHVSVAIGPWAAQVKQLSGLPVVADDRVRQAMIRESAGRLFLRNGAPLMTSAPWTSPDGTLWGAAFDGPVIDALSAAARNARIRLGVVVPAVLVVGRAVVEEKVLWPDGDIAAVAEFSAMGVSAAQRTRTPREIVALTPVPELAALGPEAWQFADAYGAAASDSRDPALLQAARNGVTPRRRVRVWVPTVILAVVVVAALLAPGVRATRAAQRHASALAALQEPHQRATSAILELRRFEQAMSEISAFRPPGGWRTVFLHSLTSALPDSVAVTQLRLDTAGGTITLLGRRATTAVTTLERMSQIAGLTLVGPVTHERVADMDHERLMLRFTWSTRP